LKLNINKN